MGNTPTGLPKVAIIGRPNVGKSSLFNRVIGKRKAIVYKEMGTTRDSVSEETVFKEKRFILIDTGGFSGKESNRLFGLVKGQIKKAIEEADILLFVCDAQTGVVPQDFELASALRKSNKKILLVVNKADNQKISGQVLDFYQLGLDRPYPVSALNNLGIQELLNDLVKQVPDRKAEKPAGIEPIKVAIVGRPNVGKSSFLNRLLNEERVLVDEAPGTTRDTIDTHFKDGQTEFILIDTAGLRHKRKVKEAVDVYSILRTKEALKRSEACLVLIDAYEGLVVDDIKILDLVLKEGKCLILCANKWDLIKDLPQPKYKEMLYKRAFFLRWYPVLFTSTKTGYNVYNSLGVVKEAIGNADRKVPTHQLNEMLNSLKSRGPFSGRVNRLKLNYITQTNTRPPVFLIFVNKATFVGEQHKNFIENAIRENFGFFGTPIILKFRGGMR